MTVFSHPLWLVGFRPFFSLAALAGLSLPLIWVAMFSGLLPAPAASFSMMQWHAHEMFFGFGWAVLAGFLLTSTKNWVGVRGYHGGALVFLAGAWLLDRFATAFGASWSPVAFLVSSNLFLVSSIAMLLATLLGNREKDSYRDNGFFILGLPLFLPANTLILSPDHFQAGWLMALGLFRLAILIMLERTLTQFMRGAFQVEILRDPRLDTAIKAVALTLVFAGFMSEAARAALSLLLALLAGGRLVYWKPKLALKRLDIGIMYLAYMALVLQLLIEFLDWTLHPAWVGTASVHVFTLGAMGLVVPALMMRIAKGHTGRKVAFDEGDKLVLRILVLGFLLRVIAPQILPSSYLLWLALTATCWLAAFAILAWRYIPYLLQPRVDGKVH
jgi:uncharacterized protein involved in response to NO